MKSSQILALRIVLNLFLLAMCATSGEAFAQETTSVEHEARIWKSKSGKFETNATFVRQTESHVFLKLVPNGKSLEVAIEKLSKEDVRYLRSLAEKTPSNERDTAIIEPAMAEEKLKPTASARIDLDLKDLTAKLSRSSDGELKACFISALASQDEQKILKLAAKQLELHDLVIQLTAKQLAREGKMTEAKQRVKQLEIPDLQGLLLGEIGRIEAFTNNVADGLKTIRSTQNILPDAEFMVMAPTLALAFELHQTGRKKEAALAAAALPEHLASTFPMAVQRESRKFDINRLDDPFLLSCIENSLLKNHDDSAWMTTRLACVELASTKPEKLDASLTNLPSPPQNLPLLAVSAKYLELFALQLSGHESAIQIAKALDSESPAEVYAKKEIRDQRNLRTYLQVVTGSWDEQRIRDVVLNKLDHPNFVLVGVGCALNRSGRITLLKDLLEKSNPENRVALAVGALFQ